MAAEHGCLMSDKWQRLAKADRVSPLCPKWPWERLLGLLRRSTAPCTRASDTPRIFLSKAEEVSGCALRLLHVRDVRRSCFTEGVHADPAESRVRSLNCILGAANRLYPKITYQMAAQNADCQILTLLCLRRASCSGCPAEA